MQIQSTSLPGVQLIRPRRHGDPRGWFAEIFNAEKFGAAGLPTSFVQDNQSFSTRGVLRGLHFQLGQPQGKLIRVLSGHIWDVAVDLRRDSPLFGQWVGVDLRPRNAAGELEMLWIPEGFGHGFLVLSETAEVLYKVTRPYYPQGERTLLWNDPTVAVQWPLEALDGTEPAISSKDAAGVPLDALELP
jgi:dTDP-4-dehydrorhamnose 3,5-epimerase